MKNLFFALFAITAFTVFSGCEKDEPAEPAFVSEFTYDGTDYELTNGYYNNLGAVGGGNYDWDVILSSKEVTINASNQLVGTGEYIYLDLNANSAENLVPGTYNWANQRDAFTLVAGSEITVDYNTATFQGTRDSLTGGTVTVAVDGSETTITFTLNTQSGKTVSGQWKGELVDY